MTGLSSIAPRLLPHLGQKARHGGIPRFQPAKNLIGIMNAARIGVSQTPLQSGIKGGKGLLALLHKTDSLAQYLAAGVVAAAFHKTPDRPFQISKGNAAGHGFSFHPRP
jgi:hypothetical protein